MSLMDEKKIEIVHRLYEARRTLKSLFPDEFYEKVKPFQEDIRLVAEKKGITNIEALILLLKACSAGYRSLWFQAAYAEIEEPSEEEKAPDGKKEG
jgi:hypothetical protein